MFARRRAIQFAFRPWKKFHVVRMKVNKQFNTKLLAFKRKMFGIMKDEVQSNRRYRIGVIENWKGYANLIMSKPFRAWKEYVDAVRNKHNEQVGVCVQLLSIIVVVCCCYLLFVCLFVVVAVVVIVIVVVILSMCDGVCGVQAQIVNAYIRWKRRNYMLLILRTWRHQSLFGRVVGMYPIIKLLKSLSDQKTHAVGKYLYFEFSHSLLLAVHCVLLCCVTES